MENSISRHLARSAAVLVACVVLTIALSPQAQHAIAVVTAGLGAL